MELLAITWAITIGVWLGGKLFGLWFTHHFPTLSASIREMDEQS